MAATTPQNLLQAIHAVGEEMVHALDGGEIEQFAALTHERGTLLERLSAYDSPADIDPDWERTAQALAEQHARLTQAVLAQENRLGESLASLERFRSAQQQYHQRPRGGRILNDDLRV